MSRINNIQLQAGIASLDQDGESPLISNIVNEDENNTAVILTSTNDASISAYAVSYPLYNIASSVSGSSTYHYLVASSS